MPRTQSIMSSVVVMVIVLFFGFPTKGADLPEAAPSAAKIVELRPGMVTILRLTQGRTFKNIVIGNPNIADASAINLGAIAITGKGVGLTNLILFDEEGNPFSNWKIQVVQGNALVGARYVEERREIRVMSLWGGAAGGTSIPKDRRYLCAENCSQAQLDEPKDLNPPSSNYTGSSGDRNPIYYPSATLPPTPYIGAPASGAMYSPGGQ